MKGLLSTIALMIVVSSSTVYAQEVFPVRREIDPKVSEAYSLLIQRKAKVQSELDTLVTQYSSEWPPAKQLQFELDALKSEMKKMSEVDQSKVSKLTSGYGRLILRKVYLAGEIQLLLQEESSEWPLTKEKQRELELLDKEIQKLTK
jgi:hypothetical protein